MKLRTGDAYNSKTFFAEESALVELFKKEGYIAPIVHLGATEDPADGNVVVEVNIDKGDFFHIRRFVIKGNRAFSKARLFLRIKTYKS